jgi:hypothetical protein
LVVSVAPDLALLQGPQQLHLEGPGQLAHLVEEERPAVRRLEEPLLVPVRSRERATDEAEELRLEELLGDPPAVDGDEGHARAQRLAMQHPGDQLLPRPAGAGDEHGGVVGRHLLRHLHRPPHGRRADDDLAEAGIRPDLPAQAPDLLAELLPLLGLAHDEQDIVGAEGLRNVVVGAFLHGLHGQIQATVRRHDQDQRPAAGFPVRLQELEAVELRHADVAENEIRLLLLGRGQPLLAVLGLDHVVPGVGQDEGEGLTESGVVVDDEDLHERT